VSGPFILQELLPADRACIATAIKLGGTAVPADRVWTELDLGCEIELIG